MRLMKVLGLLVLLAAVFAGGYVSRGPTAGLSAPAAPASDSRKVLYYVDPMHPAYTSDTPGVAPDCGMQLEPVYATTEPVAPSGAIRIPAERQQLIGVTYETVRQDAAVRTIRTVGKVAADETRIGHVHTRIDGWIEQVMVDFTGDIVRQGEPMLTVYSPEMLASQQELLLARRARDLMSRNPLASAAQHGESLFEAAKRRLQLWDLSEDQIQQVLATGQPIRSIVVHAPMSGFVTARNAFPSQRVTPDSDLYTITDLSQVWVVADVFESDVPSIRLGDRARISFSNNASPALSAQVSYIQPQVDPVTRTVQVRLNTANPSMRLKPDMFVNVEFGVTTGPQVTVSADAVLDTGDRQTVFVDLGDGYLEPRRVTVGERFADRIAILDGVREGERVVASGTFLIDSESQLKAAADDRRTPARREGSPAGPPAPAPAAEAPRGGHRHD